MAESHVVSGLKAKRDEIHRIVRECEAKIKAARADLAVINEALKIFGESVDGLRRYERYAPLFEKGELFRPICDALRNAPDGLSTVQIATIVMQNKGMDVQDNKLFARAAHRVGLSLQHYKKNGRFVAGGFDGKARIWSLPK